jgi:putative transposase
VRRQDEKSKFTEEQIVGSCGRRIATSRDSCQASWGERAGNLHVEKRFGSFQPHDVRRLKQLELANGRLKKLVAKRDLEIEVVKEIAAKNW